MPDREKLPIRRTSITALAPEQATPETPGWMVYHQDKEKTFTFDGTRRIVKTAQTAPFSSVAELQAFARFIDEDPDFVLILGRYQDPLDSRRIYDEGNGRVRIITRGIGISQPHTFRASLETVHRSLWIHQLPWEPLPPQHRPWLQEPLSAEEIERYEEEIEEKLAYLKGPLPDSSPSETNPGNPIPRQRFPTRSSEVALPDVPVWQTINDATEDTFTFEGTTRVVKFGRCEPFTSLEEFRAFARFIAQHPLFEVVSSRYQDPIDPETIQLRLDGKVAYQTRGIGMPAAQRVASSLYRVHSGLWMVAFPWEPVPPEHRYWLSTPLYPDEVDDYYKNLPERLARLKTYPGVSHPVQQPTPFGPSLLPQWRQKLLASYQNLAATYPPAQLEERRQRFITRYGEAALRRAMEEDTALLHFFLGPQSASGLFYHLERERGGNPTLGQDFGSIKGGSAKKFFVWRSGSGFMQTGPSHQSVSCTEEEAKVRVRKIAEALLLALEATRYFDLDKPHPETRHQFAQAMDSESLATVMNRDKKPQIAILHTGWLHKYLAMVTQFFSFHHQGWQLRNHLRKLTGVEPPENRWECDFLWRELFRQDEAFTNCYPALLMQACYKILSAPRNYWRIATTEAGQIDRWPDMREGGFVSIGWSNTGDLSEALEGKPKTEAQEWLTQCFLLHMENRENPEESARYYAQRVYPFYAEIQPNDYVVAMAGHTLQGIGRIRGEYEFVEEDPLQKHHRDVEWLQTGERQWATLPARAGLLMRFTENKQAVREIQAMLNETAAEGSEGPVGEDASVTALPSLPEFPLNTILYGPPGTGKTFGTIRKAVEIIDGIRHESYEEAKARWNQLRADGQIEFVTFHQSYGYEEFVEGIRPVMDDTDTGTPRYQVYDGVLKRLARNAREADATANPPRYVLVIDEINRGNLSRIFGELITLIEDDKRLGAEMELTVTLPFSRETFGMPANLYLLGTMNTADKSIALVDVALRRRFEFEELMPDFALCPGLTPSMRDALQELNRRIVLRKDRDHQIGHAFFYKIATVEGFNRAFEKKVIPLLQEYFYSDWDGLRFVLGESENACRFILPLPGADDRGARNRWQWYRDAGTPLNGLDCLNSLLANYRIAQEVEADEPESDTSAL